MYTGCLFPGDHMLHTIRAVHHQRVEGIDSGGAHHATEYAVARASDDETHMPRGFQLNFRRVEFRGAYTYYGVQRVPPPLVSPLVLEGNGGDHNVILPQNQIRKRCFRPSSFFRLILCNSRFVMQRLVWRCSCDYSRRVGFYPTYGLLFSRLKEAGWVGISLLSSAFLSTLSSATRRF